jgi:putative sterol carrier protein
MPAMDYRINPSDSGPPATPAAAANGTAAGAEAVAAAIRPGSLRKLAERRGEAAFRAFVKRSDDRRLERTIGSNTGLKVIFAGMERQFDPERAAGFAGDIRYELKDAAGAETPWTVSIGGGQAKARPGEAADPKLTLRIGVADFVRLAAGDADAGKLLLDGRLDIKGDFEVAARMADMFGQPSMY